MSLLALALVVAVTCLSQVAEGANKLVFVQALWRHGDRTPISTYKDDPYQEDFWGLPWGELTTRGMKQSFLQGVRMKKRYIDDLGFISPNYTRTEITVRSADTPRCVQSALSHMAGFYDASSGTHPADVTEWPSKWTPVPIHSMPANIDQVLEPGSDCEKVDELYVKRVAHEKFIEFLTSKWWLIAKIMKHTGDTIKLEFQGLVKFYGAVQIEKDYYNLTLPDWITDDLWNELESTVLQGADYVVGAPGFGQPEETEQIRLRGGFLLNEWLNNLVGATGGASTKYKAYSAHDSTVEALLLTLGGKEGVLGQKNPEYAAVIASELWQLDDGKFYVRFVYSDDSLAELRPITQFISGCPTDSEYCPIQTFVNRCAKYVAKNFAKDCSLL